MNRSGQRWESLDSLRGIAAFLVVTFHCAQVTSGFAIQTNPLSLAAWGNIWTWLKYTPARILVSSGPSAVVLFFVLSGFVLSLPFLRDGWLASYSGFAVKRVCRIYLPFLATILISAALCALIQPQPMPTLSHWFNTVQWDQPLTLGYVGRNLAMTGLTPDMTMDLVMWSLVHELRISLIFPLLFLLTRRWPVASMAGSLVLGVICTEAMASHEATSVPMSFLDTGRFVFLFTAGILVAGWVDRLRAALSRLSTPATAGLWFLAIMLLVSPGPTVYRYFDFAWGVGAIMLLILATASTSAQRALTARAPVWLGRVSYSLYLIHVPLLIGAVHLTDGVLPLWVTMLLAVLASLVCAELMFRWIEVPSMRVGRTLAARLAKRADRAAPSHGAAPSLRMQGTRS